MRMADKTITCYVEQPDESYARYMINGVSWREKTAVNATDKGLALDNYIRIRIPVKNAPEGFIPQKEMFVLLGACTEQIGADTKIAALKRKYNGVTIKAIHHNTDGQCPHWSLEGV